MQLKKGRVQMFVATRYATKKRSSSNVQNSVRKDGVLFVQGDIMQEGHFYYLSDQYFIDFPDRFLMKNKEVINGQPHNRPCFYAFKDINTGLYWMIPFSSQVDKFRDVYNKKVKKYKYCNTIKFGYVLGHEKAFLIQNMCPVADKYILNKYLDGISQAPVQIDNMFAKKLIADAKRVLLLQRQGKKLIFPDVLKIEAELLS